MPTHRGRKVFRPQGQNKDFQVDDWESYARKAVLSGGRIARTDRGDIHIISPSGSHWGTYRSQQGTYQGGSLEKLSDDSEMQDVTADYS